MKKFLLLFFLFLPIYTDAAGLSHIKTHATYYGPSSGDSRWEDPNIPEWVNSRFTTIVNGVGGINAVLQPIDTKQFFYFDVYVIADFNQLTQYNEYMRLNSKIIEPTFVHALTDYTTSSSLLTWNQADKFDRFENAKGVMRTSDDINFTDLTSTAYSGSVTWQNTMYIGYELPFDQVNITITTPGIGITKIWEYWNGSSWGTLSITDGSNNFANSGQISFSPPASWSRKIINGSKFKYFIRCRITAASTSPISSVVKGDTWLNGSTQAARGWNSTDPNIINAGTELEYNTTPPAGSSAKFPYQARITAWGANHFVMNPANIQDTVRPWSQYLADFFITKKTAGWDIMCDDMGGGLPYIGNNDFAGNATDYTNQMKEHIHEMVTTFHAAHPTGIIGGNYYTRTNFPYTDFALIENMYKVPKPADPQKVLTSDHASEICADDFISPGLAPDLREGTNPDRFGLLMFQDPYDNLLAAYGVNVNWDRADRGPIAALAKYYIIANSNTYFEYETENFYYHYLDEVLLKNATTIKLSDGVIPPVADVAIWYKWFPAIEVNVGTPDINGYNGGARNLQWIVGPTSGDGTADVWRRDYTNAIILLREAHANGGDLPALADDMNSLTKFPTISLGATYYPLHADGTTTNGVNSIYLRAGEGAILMKTPIGGGDSIPPVSILNTNGGRFQTSQSVTITSEETASYYYCLTPNCTPNLAYSAPFKVLQNIANQTLRYRAIDLSSNAEEVKEQVFSKQRRR